MRNLMNGSIWRSVISFTSAKKPLSASTPPKRDKIGKDGTGQDRTGQDRTGQDRTGQDRTGQDRIGQDRTGQTTPSKPNQTNKASRDATRQRRTAGPRGEEERRGLCGHFLSYHREGDAKHASIVSCDTHIHEVYNHCKIIPGIGLPVCYKTKQRICKLCFIRL